MFFIAEYTKHDYGVCALLDSLFGGWNSPFPATWTITYYLPSVILIPFGLWSFTTASSTRLSSAASFFPGSHGDRRDWRGTHRFPAVNEYLQGPFWLLSKIFFFLFFYVWARGTLPRFRYDQLMNIGWKLLLPASIANVHRHCRICALPEQPMSAPLIVFFVLAALAIIRRLSLNSYKTFPFTARFR